MFFLFCFCFFHFKLGAFLLAKSFKLALFCFIVTTDSQDLVTSCERMQALSGFWHSPAVLLRSHPRVPLATVETATTQVACLDGVRSPALLLAHGSVLYGTSLRTAPVPDSLAKPQYSESPSYFPGSAQFTCKFPCLQILTNKKFKIIYLK